MIARHADKDGERIEGLGAGVPVPASLDFQACRFAHLSGEYERAERKGRYDAVGCVIDPERYLRQPAPRETAVRHLRRWARQMNVRHANAGELAMLIYWSMFPLPGRVPYPPLLPTADLPQRRVLGRIIALDSFDIGHDQDERCYPCIIEYGFAQADSTVIAGWHLDVFSSRHPHECLTGIDQLLLIKL